jgi:DNA-binding GntR family transcriptional regulator
VKAISDLPMLHDMDADYTPQYVKLARLLREKITSGEYEHGEPLPADSLAAEHRVSVRVVCHTLEMLAANRYVRRPGKFSYYVVTWQADALCGGGTGQRSSRRSRQ